MLISKNLVAALAGAALSMVVPAIASASTIILDTFSRTGGLDGTAPNIAQTAGDTWTAPGDFTTNGSVVQEPSAIRTASLPFSVISGNIYTLSADLTLSDVTTGNWLALGFLPTSKATDVGASIFTNMNNIASPWALLRGNGGVQAFAGPSTNNMFVSADAPADGAVAGATTKFALVLDTTGAFDTVKLLVHGAQVGSTFTYSTSTPNPTIGSIAIGSFQVAGTADNVTVSTVPEPASIGILALAGVGMLARRRRA